MANKPGWIDHVDIKVEGNSLSPAMMDSLIEVTVDTTLHLPAMFVLRFHDESLDLLDSGPFRPGAAVAIELTPADGDPGRVIVGEITAIEPEFTRELQVRLTIRGYDRSHRLNREPRSEVYVEMTDSDIARKIASAAGLKIQSDDTGEVYPHLYQHNLTDLAFLQLRAERIGYEVFVEDRTLYFRKPTGARGEQALEWGVSLRSFYPRMTLLRQVEEVIVQGWDSANRRVITGSATTARTVPEIQEAKNPGAQATAAFQSPARKVVVRQHVTSQRDAEMLAQSILNDINAGFVEAEGVASGNPALVAGTKVSVQQIGNRFSGKYMITSATHVYASSGYEVHFRVEGARPRLLGDAASPENRGSASSGDWGGVYPAVVTNNVDDQDMGRVKVAFPWLSEGLESAWARLAAPGAGASRGMFWLPEVNDEVLVAFEHGDFNSPYVIGSLWNGQDTPPESVNQAVQGGKVELRTFKTREGHTLRFADESAGSFIEIVDAQGLNQIKLDMKSNKLTITSKGDVVINSTGQTEISATTTISIKASASLSIEASGPVSLKGATVNIN